MIRRSGLLAVAGLVVLLAVVSPDAPPESRIAPGRLLAQVINADPGSPAALNGDAETVFSLSPAKRVNLLQKNYTPLVEGDDSVDGVRAWVVRLRPAVKCRPWRQCWVDKRSFSILALREWSHNNKVRRAFTVRRGAASAAAAGAQTIDEAAAEDVPALRGLRLPSFVPSGFVLSDVIAWKAERTTQVVYSDGMFSISVFYRPLNTRVASASDLRPLSLGQATIVTARAEDMEVTIVADLPGRVLLRMARSLG